MMKRVLVLEDEPFISMDLEAALNDRDLDAVTATNNTDALALIDAGGIDAAILDVNLGGAETCTPTVQELDRRDIAFVLCTGDLNRAGELVRELNGPVIEKPANSQRVVERLIEHATMRLERAE